MGYQVIFTDHLYHHGIKGQKWGIRRFQNEDGSYKQGAQGRYNDDGKPGPNKSRSGKSLESKNNEEKKSNKSKYVKAAAIVAGTAAVTAAIIYAKKSGALDRGKDFIKDRLKGEEAKKPISQVKPKSDIVEQMERLGIATPFTTGDKITVGEGPERVPGTNVIKRMPVSKTQVPKVEVPRKQLPKVEVPRKQVSSKPTPKKLSDFEFVRRGMMRPDGKIDYIDVPVDKEGYAKVFAQDMAKGQTSGKDYEYYLKYMTDKLKYM